MNKRKRLVCCFLLLFLLTGLIGCRTDRQESRNEVLPAETSEMAEYKIGIICWNGENMLSNAVNAYIDYLEEYFPVKLEFVTPSMGFLNYREIAEYLCGEGVDAILNVTTRSLTEVLEVCEENQVYLMQMWDMPSDTDQLARCKESPYFLGYIKNEEETTAKEMAERMVEAGCKRVALFEVYYCNQDSQVHEIRSNELVRFLEQKNPNSVQKIVRTAYRRAAIQNLADQEYELDGMIFTSFNNEWTLEEIQELFSNRDMKFAYYDINDQTREQLENGNLLVVSCGQHNVFGLCFAYLYGFLNQNLKKEEMLALSCDYLRLSSVSDYDTYIQYCVEEMPYDAQTIQTIADSLNEGTELLEEYCRTYSLETIAK